MSDINRMMNQVGPSKMILIGGVVGGLVLFLIFISSFLGGANMAVVFSNLEPRTAMAMSQKLAGMGVSFELRDNNRSIYAPQNEVTNVRMLLADDGMGGSVVGMELFDEQASLGTTNFQQNVNLIRATEGELSRTLTSINGITSARVHVVMPQRARFQSERQEPTASVLLNTGAGFESAKAKVIQSLVATAIPGLSAANITVADQRGSLLAAGGGDDAISGYNSLIEQRITQENLYRSRIEQTLENIVGTGNVRAQVSIKMSTSEVTRNSRVFDPETQVTLGTETREETSQSTEGSSGSVSVSTQLPDGGGAGGGATNGSTSSKTAEITNFENSSTVTTEVKKPGDIERISVAVVVGLKPEKQADGTLVFNQQWSQPELDQMENMIYAAIGGAKPQTPQEEVNATQFVELTSMPFINVFSGEKPPEPETILGFTPQDLRGLIEIVVFGVVAILVLLLVVRPLVVRIAAAIPEAGPGSLDALPDQSQNIQAIPSPDVHGITPELAAAAASGDSNAQSALSRLRSQTLDENNMSIETQIDVAQVEGKVQDSAIKKVGDIVMRHPEESAAVVRQWLYSD